MDKLKILFLAANPVGSSPLKLDEESRSIQNALRQGKYGKQYEFLQHWAVRINDLQTYLLETKPHIVHFSGHSSKNSEIVLQNEHGVAQTIPQKALKNLFTILRGNIRCVVLNACYSVEQAEAIAESIDCVIGMSDAIGDDAAIHFSSSFYQALAHGESVQKAFNLGRNRINLSNLGEQDKPKLITGRKNANNIFLVKRRKILTPHIIVIVTGVLSFLAITGYFLCRSNCTYYELPEFPPSLQTNIAVAPFNHCTNDKQTDLIHLLKKTFKGSEKKVTVTPLNSNNPQTFIKKAKTDGIDLVIWGNCDIDNSLKNINFELLEEIGAPEIYVPKSLSFNQLSTKQYHSLAKSISAYMYRDVLRAKDFLTQSISEQTATQIENKSLLYLLLGNIALFKRDYLVANHAFTDGLSLKTKNEAAHFHNLGIAQMNLAKKQNTWNEKKYESALTSFENALKKDETFKVSYIAMGMIESWLGVINTPNGNSNFNKSREYCKKGLSTEDEEYINSLARYCLNQLQIRQFSIKEEKTVITLKYQQNAVFKHWTIPFITNAKVAFINWKNQPNLSDKNQMIHVLEKALYKNRNNVHTDFSMANYSNVRKKYLSLITDNTKAACKIFCVSND